MIGVAVKPTDQEIVHEFFQLFKTAWEFERPGVRYDVLICSSGSRPEKSTARLVIVYGAHHDPLDEGANATTIGNRVLVRDGDRIPIYGHCLGFTGTGTANGYLVDEGTHESASFETEEGDQKFIRIGFDLFAEIRFLLQRGQPTLHAHIPTLELHIGLVRDLLRQNLVSFVEIPAVPAGFRFIACLTHDVDHATIRVHRLDHTIAGFLYRAVIGSLIDLFRGRKTVGDVVINWLAAASLPLVYVGLAPDFWDRLERYGALEGGSPSTFFVIPKRGDPGRNAPARRAVRYKRVDLSKQLRRLQSSHHEIGVHGIDAWCETKQAEDELAGVRSMFRPSEANSVAGVRMHWLYYDDNSPAALEKAGFSYDSTIGYNETIGYRAGTCQVYKPLGVERLMELPMHAMDTALLFPSHMNLSPTKAKARIDELIANARRFGGVLTINWHDRSIAPERLWHRLYSEIIAELKKNGAWFATGSEAVAWFQKRRAATFDAALGHAAGDSDKPAGSLIRPPGLKRRGYNAFIPPTARVSPTESPRGSASSSEFVEREEILA